MHFNPDKPITHTHTQVNEVANAYVKERETALSQEGFHGNNLDDSVLAGFRGGYREHVALTAEKTLSAGVSATKTILQMAGWIQEMRSRLSGKEFGAFVKGLLQWVGEEARKYLDIARVFEAFDLSRLVSLEPFTILKLRSKRYAPVVAKLREQPVITPKLVQDLIRELLPRQSRKKPAEPISGWKQCRSGRGRYYNILLHDEETGKKIEEQAEAEGILPQTVIAEAVALRSQHNSSVQPNDNINAQLEELQTVVEHARTLDAENRKLVHQLQELERKIAELEARLAERAAVSSDEVGATSHKVNEYLEQQDSANAPEYITKYESETIAATDCFEPEQESEYLEPAQEHDYLVEPEEHAQNLEPEPQAIHVGDRVEIVSSRQGAELIWEIGIVKVANTVGCVVEVLGKTLWFCIDEIVLV